MAKNVSESGSKNSVSLTEQAYIALREMVITCELIPGSDVKEPELAEKLQMSKTPVREAMGRLCLEGLMEAFPRRGYRVSQITLKDMNDHFAVRSILESAAAGLAAKNLNDEQLSMLDELAHVQYVVGEDVSIASFVSSNLMFHTAIAKSSNNPRLINLIVRYLEEGTRFLYLGTRTRDVNVETNSDHHNIIAALHGRDQKAAADEMSKHLENTRVGLLQVLVNAPDSKFAF